MVEFSKERRAERVQSFRAVQGDESDRGVGTGGEDVSVVGRHGHESSSGEVWSCQGLIKKTGSGYVVEHHDGVNEVTAIPDVISTFQQTVESPLSPRPTVNIVSQRQIKVAARLTTPDV